MDGYGRLGRRDGTLQAAGARMGLKIIMWGEGSQLQGILRCMVLFVEESRKCKPMCDGKQISSAWGRGWRGTRGDLEGMQCPVSCSWLGCGVQTPAQTHSRAR